MLQKTYAWRCPSNIALVKYWGKYPVQYPHNPSISFTLSAAYTETHFVIDKQQAIDNKVEFTFDFDGRPNPSFANKIQTLLNNLLPEFPFLSHHSWHIHTHNSFPHSAGIASSASAMGAIALCLCSIERDIVGTLADPTDFYQKASRIARLGSGSAARSIYPQAAVWGTCSLENSTNEYAIPFDQYLHPTVRDYQDTILMVNRAEKKVSSTAGHALMQNNPYAEIRYQQAKNNLSAMMTALKTADFDQIIAITEAEALQLHALMMVSNPAYILMRPNTLLLIEKIKQFRADTQLPICFTLDAGPNVHLLFPKHIAPQVNAFIINELVPYCENNYYISDSAGNGPSNIAL